MSLQNTDVFLLSRSGTAYGTRFDAIRDALFIQPRGRVNPDGSAETLQGAIVNRTGTGKYSVVFDPPLESDAYPILLTLEQNSGADDYIGAYLNPSATGFDVHVTEQDNGGAKGVHRDAGFSFFVPL